MEKYSENESRLDKKTTTAAANWINQAVIEIKKV